MEIDPIRLRKKITNIVIQQMPLRTRMLDEKYRRAMAFISGECLDTLCINPDFDSWFRKLPIENIELLWTVIITHEELHRVISEFNNDWDKLDNIAPKLLQNVFFVDGDWKCPSSR